MEIVRYVDFRSHVEVFSRSWPDGIDFSLLDLLQFRALSEQMYKSPEHHKHVRKDVVKQVGVL
jgi:hypothetical protein